MELDTIVCMDALEYMRGLPDASVDCVATSPPYNVIAHKGTKSSIHAKKQIKRFMDDGYENFTDAMPEADYQTWMKAVFTECLRVSKGLVWVNHKTRYRDGVGIHPLSFLPFPLWSEVIWSRPGGLAVSHRRFLHSHEYVFGFGRPHYWSDEYSTMSSVWYLNPETNRNGHPCPFPESLITPLIRASCPPGGVVFDPFMGSGTVAVVARKNGRRFIGCDLSAKYTAIAMRRVSLILETPPLFTTESPAAASTVNEQPALL